MMFRNSHQAVIGLIATAFLVAGCSAESPVETAAETTPETTTESAVSAEGYSGIVEGVIRNASGEPVAGAFVKLKNAERRLTFMHISQDGGRYSAIKLPAGSYTVQAVGGEFESAWSEPVEIGDAVQAVGGDYESAWSAPVEIGDAGSGLMDVSLDVERAPYLEPAWTRRAPEYNATLDHITDDRVKDILAQRCVACHSEARTISRHVDRETWVGIIDEMRLRAGVIAYPEITEEEAEIVIEYLAEHYPPLGVPDPNSRFPFELQPDGARDYRVVQYELEDALVENHDIAVDPWGHGWSNQRRGGKLGRFNPESYEFSEVELPPNEPGIMRPGNPQITRDGMLWMGEGFGNRWLRYDIADSGLQAHGMRGSHRPGKRQSSTLAVTGSPRLGTAASGWRRTRSTAWCASIQIRARSRISLSPAARPIIRAAWIVIREAIFGSPYGVRARFCTSITRRTT
jgi:hypothetical protein